MIPNDRQTEDDDDDKGSVLNQLNNPDFGGDGLSGGGSQEDEEEEKFDPLFAIGSEAVLNRVTKNFDNIDLTDDGEYEIYKQWPRIASLSSVHAIPFSGESSVGILI